jgi:thiol:disulfide interchange protein
MNFQTMSKQRKYILIAAAVGIISVFLPWITIGAFGMSESQNGFHSYGIVVFLAFAVAIAISLFGDQTRTLDQTMWMIILVAGAVAALFTILFFTNLNDAFGVVSAGFGLWIALVAAIGVLGSAWLYKNPTDNLKSGFDSLKKSMPTGGGQTTTTTTSSNTNRISELEKLIQLRNEGKISEEEYQQMKSKLL